MNNTANKRSYLSETRIDNETYFCISNVDSMRAFFMSIVSDSNHWMFIGSNGGLSAGRKDAENALFPYYTDDKIIESAENTGSKTIFLVQKDGQTKVWEPFSNRCPSLYAISRNLYKNVYGNKILFEEANHDLDLVFQYKWNLSDTYGFVRKSRLENRGDAAIQVSILDGIQNIMPYGVGSAVQNQSSNLVDAYKRNELDKDSGIGIFGLSAIIVDKAEPSESLKANIVWSTGLDHATHLLSSLQLDAFRKNQPIVGEEDIKGEKGAYFISKEIALSEKEVREWMIIADVNQRIASVTALAEEIKNHPKLSIRISEDIEKGSERLLKLNASADALQRSEDRLKDARHFSNTLFNIMRGGIFDDNYQIDKKDLTDYLFRANRQVAGNFKEVLDGLPAVFPLATIREVASASGNAAFRRLCLEYLPLKFSRRHGDPSRPWNKFSINTRDENDGSRVLDYEGNWRDIFQNWEALAHAYPEFIEGMIFRFLNASTFDGYNPYRITKHGVDWERIEPDDPWSYIGYWGDHQIIYLLKFLEFSESHYPGRLQSYFDEDIFVYTNVPYKIKPYEELLSNPKDTVDFDHNLDVEITENRSQVGADSALLRDQSNRIAEVNFVEKMLATVLAKMSNFIPEGGIWMNTQRPEWNDANNALVGNGVSVVTMCYMYRFLKFIDTLFRTANTEAVNISVELKHFLDSIVHVLEKHQDVLSGGVSDALRKRILDGLGTAGSNYRQQVYRHSLSGAKEVVPVAQLQRFTDLCLQYIKHSLRANKRPDGLYHAYNLMTLVDDDAIAISYLSEMLEGQVAVLSSGYLSSAEALEVLQALRKSALFREDQYSYLLYPGKALPGFGEKNNISDTMVAGSQLLKALVADGNTKIIEQDIRGRYHFNGNFRNANDLRKALEALSDTKYADLAASGTSEVLQIFEEVFNHKAFTGRSGTFFAYEGLGSIYWHMVSKLALAAQECCMQAIREKESDALTAKLLKHYYEITEGLGVHKSPTLYGAFPTDPYSHTPAHKGAQQPGMTGQVKEDILCRIGELGIEVREGRVVFDPSMLRQDEFLTEAQVFEYIDVHAQRKKLELEAGSLCFSYCQIPVVYRKGEHDLLEVVLDDGERLTSEKLELDHEISRQVFERSGRITCIIAKLQKNRLQ
jgi:hypothetical protein